MWAAFADITPPSPIAIKRSISFRISLHTQTTLLQNLIDDYKLHVIRDSRYLYSLTLYSEKYGLEL
jgi:hypothetical protein